MANVNKVILIGRLTRDTEPIAGGKGVSFGFAVSGRKKDASGAWVDDPMFIDCVVFNRDTGTKLADLVRDRCKKGSQLYLEGELRFETWDDKATGAKRIKHKLMVFTVQLLDGKPAPGPGTPGPAPFDNPPEGAGCDAPSDPIP